VVGDGGNDNVNGPECNYTWPWGISGGAKGRFCAPPGIRRRARGGMDAGFFTKTLGIPDHSRADLSTIAR
jgi:hypothetical protein